MPEAVWEAKANRLLRSEMTKRGVTYAELVRRLEGIGVKEDERNLRNKVARGKFTTALFLQCLHAIGTRHLDISDL